MYTRWFSRVVGLCGMVVLLVPGISMGAMHPMDPLSESEITDALTVLQQSGKVKRGARMAYMRLYEMPKSEVLAWKPGDRISRRAEMFVVQEDGFFRIQVSLDTKTVESYTEVDEGQAPFVAGDYMAANSLIKQNKEWQDAIRKRGITDLNKVINITFSTGYYGDPAEKNQRLTRVASYYPEDTPNFWGRPIGGLSALIDMKANKVIEVVDTGVVPIPKGTVEFSHAAVGQQSNPVNKVGYQQPGGVSFKIDGHVIRWQDWEMHYRVEQQNGLILSNVTYSDKGEKRSVLYQGAVSELFVPYMDPTPGWYSRTFIDAGEFGLGVSLTGQLAGADCPDNAVLLDAVMAGVSGRPQTFENVVSVFERYSGNPLWRHQDPVGRSLETRRNQELVIRTIATVGNYDYLFDWVFSQDGGIKVDVGATGICSAKAVESRDATEAASKGEEVYGRFVDEYTVAVNHDHFVMYRLDFDVDGPSNHFVKDMLKPIAFDAGTPRRSGWIVESRIAEKEQDAQLRVNMERPAMWRIGNSTKQNAWGYATGYMFHPGMSHISLLSDEDWPQRRAAFSKYTMWVTPYAPDEQFAAGPFPNQSDGSGGIAEWTSANRNIRDTDIVAWYSMGFHHIVRAEDWPVMPTSWHSFSIVPHNFFDENPAMDIPTSD